MAHLANASHSRGGNVRAPAEKRALLAVARVVRGFGLIVMAASAASPLGVMGPAFDTLTVAAPTAFALGPFFLIAKVLGARFGKGELATVAAGWIVAAGLLGLETTPANRLQVHSSPAAAPVSIKVVAMNVWDGNREPERTRAFLRAENADVLVLEEAREPFLKALKEEMPEYATQVTCARSAYCGVVILSRLAGAAIEGGRAIARSPLSHDAAAPLNYAAARLTAADQEFTVLGVHLPRNGMLGASTRELKALCHLIKGADDPSRMLLAGDFNTRAPSFSLFRFDACAPLVRRTRALATWPAPSAGYFAPAPLIAIDHFYAGRDWAVTAVSRAGGVGSDHYAVVATAVLMAPR